ncbi:MAG: hypothetical protein AAF184_25475 [Pseudomonadota bacterium]
MDDQDWKRLETLFAQAVTLPQGERHAFAVRKTGDDPALQAQLLAMLEADEQPSSDGDLLMRAGLRPWPGRRY